MSWIELYYAYLHYCEKDNHANMRDPAHDFMEWNHTLPQCLFGDQPPGQWLTREQHAVASALQTLAFDHRCFCNWHKPYIPSKLWALCSKYYGGRHNPRYGKPMSEEGKRKSSETQKGRSFSEQHLVNLRKSLRSQEHRQLLSERQTGKTLSEETREKISLAKKGQPSPNKGKTTPENVRAKQSQNKKQKFRCLVTGFESSNTGLTKYQTRRNIDTSLRIKVN